MLVSFHIEKTSLLSSVAVCNISTTPERIGSFDYATRSGTRFTRHDQLQPATGANICKQPIYERSDSLAATETTKIPGQKIANLRDLLATARPTANRASGATTGRIRTDEQVNSDASAADGLEGAARNPTGIAIGGSFLGSVNNVPGGRMSLGNGAGIGNGTRSEGLANDDRTALKGAGAAARKASVLAIPPALQRTTSPYVSEVYVEDNFYALYEDDSSTGISVPGNEICLEGDHLRTIDPAIFRKVKPSSPNALLKVKATSRTRLPVREMLIRSSIRCDSCRMLSFQKSSVSGKESFTSGRVQFPDTIDNSAARRTYSAAFDRLHPKCLAI